MSQTAITVTQIPANYSGDLNAVTFQAADTSNGNSFPATGNCILLVKAVTNDEAGTIDSVDDPYGRTSDITLDVPSGDTYVDPVFPIDGYAQSDGTIHLMCSESTTTLAVLQRATS